MSHIITLIFFIESIWNYQNKNLPKDWFLLNSIFQKTKTNGLQLILNHLSSKKRQWLLSLLQLKHSVNLIRTETLIKQSRPLIELSNNNTRSCISLFRLHSNVNSFPYQSIKLCIKMRAQFLKCWQVIRHFRFL